MVFEVTPWNVKGKVNYEKLIKEFGIKTITPELLDKIKKHTRDLHIFLKRGVFFAHRDLDWILNKYKNGEKFYLYTGRGPTESMHIGHLVPMMFTKWLQEKFKTKVYLQFTDDEKFLFKKHLKLEKIESFTRENIIDILALGFNEKNTIVIQDTKHINYLYEEAIKVSRIVTFSMVKATFGLKDSSNIGQIFYTSLQTVPAFLESKIQGKNVPCLIPLGVDQDPHFRITRDVAPKLGYYKPAIIHSKFMPSLRGDDKMSSSKPEACIFLTDDEETVKRKVWRALSGGGGTLREHKEKGGNPEKCIIFKYLYSIFEEDDNKIEEIREGCRTGRTMCGECKELLTEKINKFLKEHRKRRKRVEKKVEKYFIDNKIKL